MFLLLQTKQGKFADRSWLKKQRLVIINKPCFAIHFSGYRSKIRTLTFTKSESCSVKRWKWFLKKFNEDHPKNHALLHPKHWYTFCVVLWKNGICLFLWTVHSSVNSANSKIFSCSASWRYVLTRCNTFS